jgi:hypothetical protein
MQVRIFISQFISKRIYIKPGFFALHFIKNISIEVILYMLKGSRQRESRGLGNVSYCPNLSLTVAMDVIFSIDFAVVFDFKYFRFRPSKAK